MHDPQSGYAPDMVPLVDRTTTTVLTLSDLPPELILRIASLLEVEDLLALRRCQKYIHKVTQDKLLWRGLLRDLRPPLPRTVRSRGLNDLLYPELEKSVLTSLAGEERWLKRRDRSSERFTVVRHSRIRFLDILDDRWVVVVSEIGSPTIWDTQENPPRLYLLPDSPALRNTNLDAVAVIDPSQGDIIIGLQKMHAAPEILRVHLAEPRNGYFKLTTHTAASITHFGSWILALEPLRNLVITTDPTVNIMINDWVRSWVIDIPTPGVDGGQISMFLLGLRVVGDYALIFRAKWIELRRIPSFAEAKAGPAPENRTDHNSFHLKPPDGHFIGVSSSEPQPNPDSPDDSRIVYVLARSATTCFFYFRVTIYNPEYAPSGPQARMSVDLAGVYESGTPPARQREDIGRCWASKSWLGPEGKRAVWVERPGGKPMDFVVAVSFDTSCPGAVPVEPGDDLEELCEIAPRIESTSDVFISTGDADRNVMHCGFSEVTGKIVLGMRDNRIIAM